MRTKNHSEELGMNSFAAKALLTANRVPLDLPAAEEALLQGHTLITWNGWGYRISNGVLQSRLLRLTRWSMCTHALDEKNAPYFMAMGSEAEE